MSKIVFDDGKVVELSKETTERLRKELLESRWKHGDVVETYSQNKRIIVKVDGFGKTVELSKETERKLREILSKPKFVDVGDIRLSSRDSPDFPIGIAISRTEEVFGSEPSCGLIKEDYLFTILSKEEAQELVDKLQEVINNL